MNNQYKPLPTPQAVPGCVTQPGGTDGKVAGTVTTCQDVNAGGVGGSVVYSPKGGGGE